MKADRGDVPGCISSSHHCNSILQMNPPEKYLQELIDHHKAPSISCRMFIFDN
jgi:hypothetical protein